MARNKGNHIALTSVEVTDSNIIEKAEFAINAENNAYVFADSSGFRNNYMHIRFVNQTLMMDSVCFGTSFLQTNTLLYPYKNEKFYAGILAVNCDKMIVGDSLRAKNYFSNSMCGVEGILSDVSVINNNFTLIGRASPCLIM